MKIAISVFAKTLGLSPVKTRLAQTLGEDMANAFYIKSVTAVNENLKELYKGYNEHKVGFNSEVELSVYWTLAEEEGIRHSFWNGKTCLWTGEGGLGERLHQVSQNLFQNHDYVFFMGTDSPQVGTPVLQKAVEEALNSNKHDPKSVVKGNLIPRQRVIIGPCSDGGFYLLGVPVPLSKSIWTGITYSQENTCQQLMDQLEQQGFEIELLPTYGDVDVIEDLDKLKRELSQLGDALNQEQINLLDWLNHQRVSK